MYDLKLTNDGDLDVSALGDVSVIDSICQDVKVRLKWIQGEWRLGPDLGFPYYDEVLVKNPDFERIRQVVRLEVIQVEGVIEAEVTNVEYDSAKRIAKIKFNYTTDEATYNEEVELYG